MSFNDEVRHGGKHLLDQVHRQGQGRSRIPTAAPKVPDQVAVVERATIGRPDVNPHLGDITQLGESSGRGPGVASSGRGDRGGVSYGLYQLSTKNRKPQDFVATEGKPWADRLAHLEAGTPEYTRVWKAIAAEDTRRFGQAQQDYAKRVYFDHQAARIKKATGVDITHRSYALQEAVFSTSIQRGENTHEIANVIKSVQADTGRAASDAELIQAIYAERMRPGPNGLLVHFPNTDANSHPAIKARLVNEQQRVLDALRRDPRGAILE